MKIAIDVDGTITHSPRLFKQLAKSLLTSGNEVFILTGNGYNEMPREKRLLQLEKFYDFTPEYYTELIIAEGKNDNAVGWEKARIIKERNIDIFIDNDLSYIDKVRQENPLILILHPCG